MIIKVKDNNLYMYGIIWDGDDRYFDDYFSQLEKRYDNIVIHLHTRGGSVFAGNFIIQRIENSSATVQIDVVGVAFSMGSLILASGDKRRMVSNGFVMIHPPRGGVNGTAQDHRNAAKLLEDMEANFMAQLKKITNLSDSKIKKLMTGDNYFNAKDALKIGLIDEIIQPVTKVNIKDVSAIREEDVYGSYAAILTQFSKNKNNDKNKKPMKEAIISALGLTGVTADSSDTAVIQAVKAHYDKQVQDLKAKLEQEQKVKADLEKAIATQKQAKIDALLAPFKGKITEQQEKTYRNIAEKSGIEALETVLDGIGKRKSIKDFINKGTTGASAQGRESWDWDKWQAEDPRGLERMAEQDPESFLALGKAKFGKNFKL